MSLAHLPAKAGTRKSTPVMQSTLSIKQPAASQNRDQHLKLAAYYFTFATLGIAAFVLGPTLPSLAEQTSASLEEISFVFVAQNAGSILAGLTVTRFYDRMPAHRLVALLLTIYLLTLGVIPLASNLWQMGLAWFTVGILLASIHGGMNAMLVWVYGTKVGPYLNGLHFCFSLSAFVAPVIITQVMLVSGGIGWAYWLLALLIIPSVLILLALPSPQAPASLTSAAAGNIDYGFIALGMIFLGSFVGAELGATGWMYTYTIKTGQGTAQTGAYMMSILGGAVMLGRLLSIYTSTVLRPRTILYTNLSGALLGVLVIGLAGIHAMMLEGAPLCWLLNVLHLPHRHRHVHGRINLTGKTTGILLMAPASAPMIVPWLIGQFIESTGPSPCRLLWHLHDHGDDGVDHYPALPAPPLRAPVSRLPPNLTSVKAVVMMKVLKINGPSSPARPRSSKAVFGRIHTFQ
jgi:fucose permease